MTASLALTDLSRQYRKTMIAAPFVGGVGLLVSSLLGHPVAGVMFCVGLALGLINSRLVIGATVRFSESGQDSGTKPFIFGALKRLGAITLACFALAFLFRPEGLAAIVGLAVFQLIMMSLGASPLLREVRRP